MHVTRRTGTLATLILIYPLIAAPLAYGQPQVLDDDFKIEVYATLPSGSVEGLVYSDGSVFPAGLYATIVDGTVWRITGPEEFELFASGLPNYTYEPVLDKSGTYGGGLLVMAPTVSNSIEDEIVRIDENGVVTTFYPGEESALTGLSAALSMAPDEAFGGMLYGLDHVNDTLVLFTPDGSASPFGSVVVVNSTDFLDMEFSRGADWGYFAFVADASAKVILRVDEDGVSETFYEWQTPPQDNFRTIAFGDGGRFGHDLYAGDNGGSVTRIDADGEGSEFATGMEVKLKATEFGDNQLFIGLITNEVFRVYADCDDNGISDFEDILSGSHVDDDGNGVPDLCQMPVIVSSDPADGTVDVRQDLSVSGTTPQGFDRVIVTFDRPVLDATTMEELTTGSFELIDTSNAAPDILSVVPGNDPPNTYEVVFVDPITPGAWTTLIAHVVAEDGTPIGSNPADRVDVGFLPGDVNLDGTSTPADVLALIDSLNGQVLLPLEQMDVNRSGIAEASDVLRLIDLLNGQNSTQAWLLEQLPPRP